MSNLLRDLLPDAPQVTRLLVAAAEDRIAEVLAQHVAQGLDVTMARRLAASSFASTTLFTPEICDWVVGEFAIAAGLGAGVSADPGGHAETLVAPGPPPGNQPLTVQRAGNGPAGTQETIAAQTLGITADEDVVGPLPLPGGRPKWLVPGAAAAVAVVVLVGVLVAWSPWTAAPVLRPGGVAAQSQGLSTVTIRWLGPATGPVPSRYQILLSGNVIGSVPGTTTSYQAAGLSPDTSYQFQVVAVRGGTRSPRSAVLQASTIPEPPTSDAILEGGWQMQAGHATWYGYSSSPLPLRDESWSFSPNCSNGPCSVTLAGSFQGLPINTTLTRQGGSYSGTAKYSYHNKAGSTCGPVTVGYLTIKINVNQAAVLGNSWQATSWTGTMVSKIPASKCTAAGITTSISSSR